MNKEFIRTLKFAFVSISAGLIEAGSFALLNELFKVDPSISNIVALVLSVIWNFTINRRYTFKSASNVPKAMLLVLLYYLAFTPLAKLYFDYFHNNLGWSEYIVKGIQMLVNFATEFLYQRFIVFRKTVDTNELAKK